MVDGMRCVGTTHFGLDQANAVAFVGFEVARRAVGISTRRRGAGGNRAMQNETIPCAERNGIQARGAYTHAQGGRCECRDDRRRGRGSGGEWMEGVGQRAQLVT